MPGFGLRSREMLSTIERPLSLVCGRAIAVTDFAVICGRRGQEAQDEAFRTGVSRARWPESKHNAIEPGLSRAVDVVPWHRAAPHIRWEAEREFAYLAGHIMQAAYYLGVRIRWGGDWDRDSDLYDRNVPFDLGHFELLD